ncbi:hypothetical protein [Kitasatospora sp. NPDC088783]|uniref:hypothetical protein n=1 Tax=Kitasatospora sp. NPDC088783 TaxID=3364077 RepID=UPI00380AC3AD
MTVPAASVPRPRPAAAPTPQEPASWTTFTAALQRWNTRPDTAAQSSEVAAGARLDAQDLPPTPAGLPTQAALQEIVDAAADRARLLLAGAPVPETPLDHAVHITATRPGVSLDPAHRLGIDIGDWRALVTEHPARTGR